jgi:hypothetical protein
MVGLLIAFPQLVTGSLDKKQEYNMESIGEQMRDSLPATESPYDAAPGEDVVPGMAAPEPESAVPEDDPLKAMQEAVKGSGKK